MNAVRILVMVVGCSAVACGSSDKGSGGGGGTGGSSNTNSYDVDTASGLLAGAACGLYAKCGVIQSGVAVTNAWCKTNEASIIAAMKSQYVTSSTKTDVDACVSDIANAAADCASVCGVNFQPATCNKVAPSTDSTPTQCAGFADSGAGGSSNANSYDVDTATGLIAGATCALGAKCGVITQSGVTLTDALCSDTANAAAFIAATKTAYVTSSTKADVDACISELAGADCASVCGVNFQPASCNKVAPSTDSTPTQCATGTEAGAP